MKKFLFFLCVAVILGMVQQVQALPLELNYNDAKYLGSIEPGIPPNPANQVGYINTHKDLTPNTSTDFGGDTYNRSGLTGTFPTAVLAGSFKDESGYNSFFSDGYQYILGKYDEDKAGTLVWYLDSYVGEITIPTAYNGHALSNMTAYNPIPEPATIFILATSLLGLAGIGRKKFKK